MRCLPINSDTERSASEKISALGDSTIYDPLYHMSESLPLERKSRIGRLDRTLRRSADECQGQKES